MLNQIVNTYLQIHPKDNALVALQDLGTDTPIDFEGASFKLIGPVPAKHKFAVTELLPGDEIIMYGVLVGQATESIPRGGLLTINNVQHAAGSFELHERKLHWEKPDVSGWKEKTFLGYHRSDGSVGTAN